MASLLVTGAGGFIGRRVVAALRARGESVLCHSTKDGDIASGVAVDGPVSHVIHLAGRTFVPDSWASPPRFYETNVLGTAHVAELCRRRGARLILVSSYVYGRPRSLPIAEDHPVEPFNPYSHSKILAEEVARFYARSFGIEVTIVRPFNLYGSGQDARFLIPTLVKQVQGTTGVVEVADLRPKRDFLHVDDFVALLVAALSHPGGVYNAGSGRSIGVEELIELLFTLAHVRKLVVTRGEPRPDEVLDVVADIRKAERELGWVPLVSIESGLARTLAEA